MAECIIARGGYSQSASIEGGAQIIVDPGSNTIVYCTNGATTFTKETSGGEVTFNVGFGTWYLYGNKVTTLSVPLVVDTLQIYNISLPGTTYGIRIDQSITDPNSACSYIDDNANFSPLYCNSNGSCNYGSWKDIITDWFGVRPCLYKDGKVVGYLNPDNYTKFEDGTSADITSGNSGNVMIEFKKRWYKWSLDGDILTFEVSDYDRSLEGFTATAFLSEDGNGEEKQYFYYAAFLPADTSTFSSLSGKAIGRFEAHFDSLLPKIPSGYVGISYAKYQYISFLLVLVTKARELRSKIGTGNYDYQSSHKTGDGNLKGLFYGIPNVDPIVNRDEYIKVFGIEDFWGYMHQCTFGMIRHNSIFRIKKCAPYSSNGVDYSDIDMSSISGTALLKMKPVLDGAFLVSSLNQSDYDLGWSCPYQVASNSVDAYILLGYLDTDEREFGPFSLWSSTTMGNNWKWITTRLVAC